MGDLTGEYIWFMVSLTGSEPGEPGNAVAVEAGGGEGAGRATYFFRMTGRPEYREAVNRGGVSELSASAADRLNRCLLAVNFRREPIYLADERLLEPRYFRYRHSVRRVPELRELRDLFIGRVIHRSPEQWENDVEDLLKFNAEAGDDEKKWTRGEEEAEENGPLGDS